MQTLLQDLHYSLRQLVRSPRFAVTAVLSLALGIGAATAVFSVIYAALLNPYPYPNANRIVRLNISTKTDPDVWTTFSGPQAMELRRYLPSEVFLGKPDQLVSRQQRAGGR
jgi:hypothetical protein